MRIRLPAVRQPDSFGLGRKRAGSLVATALLFLFTYVALVDMAWANTAVHIIFAILALAALTFVIRIRETPKLTEVALGPPVAEPATREEIEEATKYVARNYDSYAIACFINLLLNPPRSLSRVHDEVEPAGRMWRVNTSLQYRIDIPRPQGRGASVTPALLRMPVSRTRLVAKRWTPGTQMPDRLRQTKNPFRRASVPHESSFR